ICYTIIDFEDGINLGLIPEDYALEYLIKLVKDKINTKKYNGLALMQDRLSYLRALAISTLISDAARIFLEQEDSILNGDLNVALLDQSLYKAQIEDIISLSVNRIYRSQEVLEKEIAGYKILSDILEVYCGALIRSKEKKASNYDGLMIQSLPAEYHKTNGSHYELLLNASSYVASLSDGLAVHIHSKITGKQL
ncbi:MAG: dGTPase, partial [Flavobacteriaceae bacterium]